MGPVAGLWFTLLFKRVEILRAKNEEFDELVSIFRNRMTRRATMTREQIGLVSALTRKDRPRITTAWLDKRANSLFNLPSFETPLTRWGWKEPNTHVILERMLNSFPQLKYIHVMRNGLDMAYSSNQQQLLLWGLPLVTPSGHSRFD